MKQVLAPRELLFGSRGVTFFSIIGGTRLVLNKELSNARHLDSVVKIKLFADLKRPS